MQCVVGLLLLVVLVFVLWPSAVESGLMQLGLSPGGQLEEGTPKFGEKMSIVLGSYLRSGRSDVLDVPVLRLDVPFENMRQIYSKREEALKRGVLIQGVDDFVSGRAHTEQGSVPIKLRLKGDWTDHLVGRKWSFRIHVRDGQQLFGMRRFSIQAPRTRGYQSEILFFETLAGYGVMSPRHSFVDVILNGEPVGLMALEEFFGKELLEHHRRRDGVIVRFDESMVWAAHDSPMEEGTGWKGSFDSFKNAPIKAFGSSRIAESKELTAQYRIAVGLLRGFVDGHLKTSEVFDPETMGRFIAVSDLFGSKHAVAWHNLRFYLDPVSLRLEPIAFDASLQAHYVSGDYSVTSSEPMLLQLLSDPEIVEVYQRTLEDQGDVLARQGRLLITAVFGGLEVRRQLQQELDFLGRELHMKIKERYVFLECTQCKHRNYTTHKRLKAAYKLEKKKFCRHCRVQTVHKEKKL